jgi:hypothetical protein
LKSVRGFVLVRFERIQPVLYGREPFIESVAGARHLRMELVQPSDYLFQIARYGGNLDCGMAGGLHEVLRQPLQAPMKMFDGFAQRFGLEPAFELVETVRQLGDAIAELIEGVLAFLRIQLGIALQDASG